MANKSNPQKNKHLTSEDRTEIQECLNRRMSFKDIADRRQNGSNVNALGSFCYATKQNFAIFIQDINTSHKAEK